MKKYLLILSAFAFLFGNAFAQISPSVFFSGTINTDPTVLDIIIEIRSDENEKQAFLYVPDQFLYAMKSSDTYYGGDSLRVTFKKLSAVYTGVLNKETNIFKGTWKQGKAELIADISIVSNEEVAFLNRPQTPESPFPYEERFVVIPNAKGNSVLSGTLTIPDTEGSYPLVILITGSGAQDRNEEIAGHKPFLVIADYLSRNGIAVFRYDDRGVNKSEGNFANSTTYDFMTDAAAVVKALQDQPNINKNMIGVAGHSEGGLIAMMLAAKYPKDIAFIISLAGPGVPMRELLQKQMDDLLRAENISEEHLKILSSMQSELLNLKIKKITPTELRKQIKVIYDKYGANFTAEERDEYRINEGGINTAVMQFSQVWMKYFLTIDPAVYLKKIKCSVLALNGTKDIQVSSVENLAAIEKYLSQGKSKNFQIKEITGLNHLFQQAETGKVQEYFHIQETISPEVLPLMLQFINSCEK